jgi:hypothetical protein
VFAFDPEDGQFAPLAGVPKSDSRPRRLEVAAI